jgi:hypothetical protein
VRKVAYNSVMNVKVVSKLQEMVLSASKSALLMTAMFATMMPQFVKHAIQGSGSHNSTPVSMLNALTQIAKLASLKGPLSAMLVRKTLC